MSKNENIENEVVETEVEETEKVGFFKKAKLGIKKNAKKIAITAGIGVVGLITGYALGKKSSDDDYCEDDDTIEADYEVSDEVE